jgi:uncharacterized protein YbaR (Trm112 family)
MKEQFVEILCCPRCHGSLTLQIQKKDDHEILEGTLTCDSCGQIYPVKEGIPYMLFQE